MPLSGEHHRSDKNHWETSGWPLQFGEGRLLGALNAAFVFFISFLLFLFFAFFFLPFLFFFFLYFVCSECFFFSSPCSFSLLFRVILHLLSLLLLSSYSSFSSSTSSLSSYSSFSSSSCSLYSLSTSPSSLSLHSFVFSFRFIHLILIAASYFPLFHFVSFSSLLSSSSHSFSLDRHLLTQSEF